MVISSDVIKVISFRLFQHFIRIVAAGENEDTLYQTRTSDEVLVLSIHGIWFIILILTLQPVTAYPNSLHNTCSGLLTRNSKIGNCKIIRDNFEDFFSNEYNTRIVHLLSDGLLTLRQSTIDNCSHFIAKDIQVHCPLGQEQEEVKLDKNVGSNKQVPFQQVKIEIVEFFAFEDKVVIYWNWHGIHLRDCESTPSSNKEIIVPGLNVYGFNSEGQIDQIWGGWDKLELIYTMRG